jgi:hypothetical protein
MKTRRLPENLIVETNSVKQPGGCQAVPALLSRVALGLPLAAAMLALAFGGPVAASGVYSIVTNPGEDCSTQMNIGWHAALGVTNSFVRYTKKTDTDWAQAATAEAACAECDVFNGVSSKTPAGEDFREEAIFLNCGVALTGLERDMEYMYQVRAPGGVASSVHHFKTAGAGEFSFVWIGDFHAYTPLPARLVNAVKVLDAARALDPGVDFIFSTGDVVAWGGSYSFWRNLYEQEFIQRYMFANVLGNHDNMTRTGLRNPDFFRVANHFPRNGYSGQEGVCYWFIYGNVLFITLNNEVMSNNAVELAAAKSWAAGVIQRLKGKYQYIFLSQHYQWFDGRDGKTSWYAHWKDFCDEHQVALALSGNNHVYQRSHPLHGDQVVAAGKGTVYMVVPSSDGDRGVKAGPLKHNAEKLAHTYSSPASSGSGQVKTIGCVLVKVTAEGIATRLVYLDENKVAQVADEHAARVLSAR